MLRGRCYEIVEDVLGKQSFEILGIECPGVLVHEWKRVARTLRCVGRHGDEFDAMGIESEGELVRHSRLLAEKYAPSARFVHGSFIPAEYEWDSEFLGEGVRSDVDIEPGYEELDMELRDFDLVYAFPWPDEQPLLFDIMKQCGADQALYLTFDAREGMLLRRIERDADEGEE